MPLDFSAPLVAPPTALHLHETPTTAFVDLESAARVSVLVRPREEDASHYLSFVRTCHREEPVESESGDCLDRLAAAAGGSTLRQASEILQFYLRIEGVTRSLTHQLVRARIGWTFSETCTGDRDWRHARVLVPRALMRDSGALESYVSAALEAKRAYASALDSGMPTTVARYSLPHGIETYLHAWTNLSALSSWYAARTCTMTQGWEMVLLAEAVKIAVVSSSPWASPAFSCPCDSGKCWYHSARKTALEHVNYYRPDEAHDRFLWNPVSFLYHGTPYEVQSGAVPFQTRTYRGKERIT